VLPPSCVGLPATCGATNDESCCASPLVPGGTYYRSNDAAYPATVSDFLLDKYEVTVGRFRKFVELYPTSRPTAGDGAHPLIPASGWDPAWDTQQPLTQGILISNVGCSGYATWTASSGPDENKPISCMNWYIAFMFCAWDGGRLPTEAEWNYAATGGAEQRLYPWGDTAPGFDSVIAVHNCTYDELIGMPSGGSCSLASIAPVGARTQGNGRWGHADLAGNMHEFNFDPYESAYPMPCVDCAGSGSTSSRVVRGGGFNTSADTLLNSARNNSTTTAYLSDRGIRCARTP
jgi:formylglycine-generating enzyme required for sulfatase activity